MASGAWGEGDPLTPTNLNNRGGGAFSTTSLYNAGWSRFTASTNTGAIQNAINQASTDNVAGVVVPASMLPYNSSTVSFIAAVHMFREGGNPTFAEYDPYAYGASGKISTDDQPALQACLDQINTNGHGTVRLTAPPAFSGPYFNVSKPVWVKLSGTRILGAEEGSVGGISSACLIAASYTYGPVIFIGNPTLTVPNIVTALLTGTGSAWQMTDSNSWFNLRDAKTLDLNGLTQFGLEFRWKPTVVATSTIIGSAGKWFNGDTTPSCFEVRINVNSKFEFAIKTSGSGIVTVTGTTTMLAGTSYDVAATWDGANARLFVNGVQEGGDQAATGTLVQAASEDVNTGALTLLAPDQNKSTNTAQGIIDGLWIRNVAGRTANYTPSGAKPTSDANTLALFNFVTQYGPFTSVDTKDGTFWAWCRQNTLGGPNGIVLQGFTVSGRGVGGSGIYVANSCNAMKLGRMTFINYRNGFYAPLGDSYRWHASDLWMSQGGSGNGRYGFFGGGNTGLALLEGLYIEGGVIPLMLGQGGGTVVNTAHLLAQANTVLHGFVGGRSQNGGPTVLNGITTDTETGVSAVFRGSLGFGIFGGVTGIGAVVNGGDFNTGNAIPHIIVDQNDMLQFNCCNFVLASGQTEVLRQINAAARPAMFAQCLQSGFSWIPWSSTTGSVVIGRIGPLISTSTSATVNFDANRADEWDLTLTGDVTASNWTHITYGQPVSGAIKMDSTGSRLFVWPTNSKGTATLSYGSSAVNTFTGFYDGVDVILTSVRTGL